MPGALSGIDHPVIDIFFIKLVSDTKVIVYIICMA